VRVLLVEHDPAMVRVLERGLRSHGFEVSSVAPRQATSTLAEDASVRIVIVDISPSRAASHKLLDQLRTAHSSIPRLLLAAGDDLDRVPPDDEHLRKPFAMEELIARLYALTRASDGQRVTTLSAGDVRLDLLARCAWRGDRLIDLPGREFALLEYFVRHSRRVLSRQEILADVWGYHMQQNASNVVDVYVRYLRNRLHVNGGASLIATVRGEGYQFNPQTEPTPGSVARTRRRPAPASADDRGSLRQRSG
jgi:two-component system OmpR family response regulator